MRHQRFIVCHRKSPGAVSWKHDWHLARYTRGGCPWPRHPPTPFFLLPPPPPGRQWRADRKRDLPSRRHFSVSYSHLWWLGWGGGRAERRESRKYRAVGPGSLVSAVECTRELRQNVPPPEMHAQETSRCRETVLCVKTCCGPPFFCCAASKVCSESRQGIQKPISMTCALSWDQRDTNSIISFPNPRLPATFLSFLFVSFFLFKNRHEDLNRRKS